ncbi:hypothetical protein BYT27DRAFT_7193457 [Phlegmacium glaucopus]|nr:hypothetical protein BYT27DRAFT_7193457 [Phlegmacium glaucopus]
MVLFSSQLARVVSAVVSTRTDTVEKAFYIIASIHEMLNVITTLVTATSYFSDNMGLSRV